MLMKQVWRHVVTALSLAAGVAAAFSACVHDDSTIFIQSVLAPQTSSQPGTLCTYTSDPTQAFLSSGVLDLALKAEYDGEFLLGNQMVSQANSSQLQTETSIVNIEYATVRITTADNQQLANYTRRSITTIPPAVGNTPGYSPIGPVAIIDAPTLASPAVVGNLVSGGTVRLLAYVSFSGTSTGGESVQSDELEYPVDICNGCLITFTNNPLCPTPNCVGNAAASATSSTPLIPCTGSIGQDIAIDCTTCSNMGIESCRGSPCGGTLDAGSD
jgi:hypothetical protein